MSYQGETSPIPSEEATDPSALIEEIHDWYVSLGGPNQDPKPYDLLVARWVDILQANPVGWEAVVELGIKQKLDTFRTAYQKLVGQEYVSSVKENVKHRRSLGDLFGSLPDSASDAIEWEQIWWAFSEAKKKHAKLQEIKERVHKGEMSPYLKEACAKGPEQLRKEKAGSWLRKHDLPDLVDEALAFLDADPTREDIRAIIPYFPLGRTNLTIALWEQEPAGVDAMLTDLRSKIAGWPWYMGHNPQERERVFEAIEQSFALMERTGNFPPALCEALEKMWDFLENEYPSAVREFINSPEFTDDGLHGQRRNLISVMAEKYPEEAQEFMRKHPRLHRDR